VVHNRARSGASTEITVSSTNAKTAQLRLAVEKRLAETDPALGRVIAAVIARIGPQRIAPSRASPFEALVRAVTYQSVSGKAAAAIFARLSKAITRPLTPSKVVAIPLRTLVKTGLSRAKAKTIGELARWFMSNRKLAKNLRALPDNEVVEHLTAIAGIGAWTVNVLLIFNLGRRDVMPAADMGIRRGVQLTDGLRAIATPKQVIERSRAWAPHRSIASIYLWQATRLGLGPNDLKRAFVAPSPVTNTNTDAAARGSSSRLSRQACAPPSRRHRPSAERAGRRPGRSPP
jgi:DNA-3-methyladenine glycosylase II